MARRLLLFLYSTGNIVGAALGLLGLAAFFLGVIDRFWLFIVVGLYLAGVLLTPGRAGLAVEINRQLTAEQLRAALDELSRNLRRRRVAKEIQERVESIKQSVLSLLPRLAEQEAAVYQLHVIQETVLDYLPQALEHYLKLPPAYATLHPVKDGKTPKQLLLEQLAVLDAEMSATVEDLHRNDTQRLLAHGRFLKEKFRRSEGWLSG